MPLRKINAALIVRCELCEHEGYTGHISETRNLV